MYIYVDFETRNKTHFLNSFPANALYVQVSLVFRFKKREKKANFVHKLVTVIDCV